MPRPRLEPDQVRHGTLAGWSWHKHWDDKACDACMKAKRDHSREAARLKRRAEMEAAPRLEAWKRACGRLAEKYPEEFRAILAEEMRGLVPPPADEGEE